MINIFDVLHELKEIVEHLDVPPEEIADRTKAELLVMQLLETFKEEDGEEDGEAFKD